AIGELGLGGAVRMLGEVPDADLPALYSGARCLVLPSRAEGFGLPPLEAMACGCPVVVSSAGALPEVVGPAGLVVPPDDVAGLAAATGAVVDDPALRRRMRDAGLRRAAGFSWERAAAETRRVHERLQDEAAVR
ncbi:MAG TPA: glycosyltransferase family 1 protein, partial [Pseudonocardia sp.]|nr:glycosyltransferase family 1 protein [Pseudonocardia sp.]